MNEKTEPIVLEGGEVSDVVSRLLVAGVLASLLVATIGMVQGLRHGFNYHYTIFLTGGLLAVVALVALPLHSVAVNSGDTKKTSSVGMLVSFGGFIPYLLGLYLLLYEGLWRLSELRDGFSIQVVLLSLLYVVLGFIVVRSIDRVSSFARKIDAGDVVLR